LPCTAPVRAAGWFKTLWQNQWKSLADRGWHGVGERRGDSRAKARKVCHAIRRLGGW